MSVSNKFIEEISGDWTLKTTTADGLITLDTGLPGTTLITGDLSVVGNVNFTGNATFTSNDISYGTTAFSIPVPNGNIIATVDGSNVAYFYADGFSVIGNITGNYIIGNGAFLTGLPDPYGNANVAAYLPTYTGNLVSLQGDVITTANISGSYILGNGSQLTGMYSNVDVAAYLPTYTGNLNPGNISVADSANVGSITLTASTGNITGIDYATANYFVGNGSLLTDVLATGVGTLGNLSVTGNIVTGNISTAGVVSAAGDVTGGNLQTGGEISATGNAVAGNVLTGGEVSATGNVSGGNVLTGGLVSATANVTGGNIVTAGTVTAGGNILASGNLSIQGRIEGSNVKIGTDAGLSGQSYNGVAIGLNAGSTNQGLNAIAIGDGAGATNQSANSIILNASGNTLNSTNPGLYISPIRNDNANNSNVLFYNVATNELTYTNSLSLTGNIAAGNLQFVNASATGNVLIDGDLTVSGNAYLSGNIVGDRIQNGNTVIDIQTLGGNANVSVNGVNNVAVFTPGGLDVDGAVSVTGNVTGNYIFGNGSQLTGISAAVSVSKIENGTSNVNITTPNGNVTVSVDGTGNVAVFSASGLNLTGNLSVTGNVIGDYFVGNGTALTGVMADRGGDPNNWNTLTQMGVYTVNRVSWSGTTGTPLDSQVYVGLLEVKNSTGAALEQIFYPGTVQTGNAQTQWNRNYWSGTWTPWLYVVNNDQVVQGGDF